MNLNTKISTGYYGKFGGAYIPEMLYNNVEELKQKSSKILESDTFQKKYKELLNTYVGRPTPLYFAKSLSEQYNCKVYLKREDLCHTGSHKINNTIGQILLAQELGKSNIIAETGAGQHGVATATVCAMLKLDCTIYMGEIDVERQKHNVERMKMLGAKVVSAKSGSRTLKDATNEALRAWIGDPEDTYYLIGSVVGPHPYPELVTYFQSIISSEIKHQIKAETGSDKVDKIIACIGGGSNAAGAFYHYLESKETELIGVEAFGKGINTSEHAASLNKGSTGILHGSKTMIMQDENGQVIEAHSISAGLDYPGIGPLHAHLHDSKRAQYFGATDREALSAAKNLMRQEGIIPALESAHAFAALDKIQIKENEVIIINLSGRGDKDIESYINHIG